MIESVYKTLFGVSNMVDQGRIILQKPIIALFTLTSALCT